MSSIDTRPAASLIVPDLNFFVYSSSCNYLFFELIAVPLLSSIKLHPQGRMDCQKVDKQWKEWRMRLKLRELHELPSTEMVKSGTIYRLTSDCRKAMEEERCPTIRKELDKCNTRLQFLADCLHFTPSGTEGTVSREEEKTSFERMSCCFRPKQKTMNFMQKSLWNLWYDLRFFGHILLRLGCHFWNAPLSICLHHLYHNLIFKTILLNQNDRTQCKSCHIVQYSQSYY